MAVETKDVKTAITVLNGSGLVVNKVKFIGVSVVDMKKAFVEAVAAIPEDKDAEIAEKYPIIAQVFEALQDELEGNAGATPPPPEEKPVKEKKEPAPKKEATPRYTRIDAFLEALKLGGDVDALAEKANALYSAARGKEATLSEAKFVNRYAIETLVKTGALTENEDGTFTPTYSTNLR